MIHFGLKRPNTKRYAISFCNHLIGSADWMSEAIRYSQVNLRGTFTFIDIIDMNDGRVVWTWDY